MNARVVGQRVGAIAGFAGLAVVYLTEPFDNLMTGSLTAESFLWIFKRPIPWELITAVISLMVFSTLIWGYAAKFIQRRKNPAFLIGIPTGFLVIILTTFIGSLVSTFQIYMGSQGHYSNFWDELFGPVFLVAAFGAMPITVVGFIMGLIIKVQLGRIFKRKLLNPDNLTSQIN